MKTWADKFIAKDIFFVTPDVKRGIGLHALLPRFHIVCLYKDPLISILRRQGAHIFCLAEKIEVKDRLNNSGKLLEHKLVLEYILAQTQGIAHIMYFKPSVKLDQLIKTNKFIALGNLSRLNEQFENKLNFFYFAKENFPEYSVTSEVGILGQLNFADLEKKYGLPFVVQFGHGWAGKTTFFINGKNDLSRLTDSFSRTKVRVSRKIAGFTVLNNGCINGTKILVSPPAMQLSGIKSLSDNPSVTCGRQWPVSFLDKKQIAEINVISGKVGKLMGKAGFRGFFGLDFLVEETTAKIFLSEINARLTASSAFYTCLENGLGKTPLLGYHLGAFLGVFLPLEEKITEITGSQIVLRQDFKKLNNLPNDEGVYKLTDSSVKYERSDYYPDKLASNEFIFVRGWRKDIKAGNEMARIETKCQVLGKKDSLKKDFSQLLSTS